jgi:Contact-dependent growth inhibition CdiA C-terminal domain
MDGISGIGSTAPIELPEIVVTPDDPLPGDGSFGDPIAGFQATNAQISAAVNGLSQQIDATIEQMRAMGPPSAPAVPAPPPAPFPPPLIAPPPPDLFIAPPQPASATPPASEASSAGPDNTGSPVGGPPPQAAALGIAATAVAPEASSASLATARQALVRAMPWVARFAGTPALVVGLASEVFNFGSIPNDAQERAMREAAERSAVPLPPDQTQLPGLSPAPPFPPLPGLTPPAVPLPNREELPVADPLPQLPGRTAAPPLPTLPGFTPVDPGPLILERNEGDPGLTRPTGEIGGAPTGTRRVNREGATPEEKRQVASEQEFADRLASHGYRVIQQPTIGENPALTPERMRALGLRDTADPDLLVEGRVFDIYTPERDDADTVWQGIADKVAVRSQADRVAIDLRGTSLTEADVRAALRANRISGLKEVITLTDRGLGRAFP